MIEINSLYKQTLTGKFDKVLNLILSNYFRCYTNPIDYLIIHNFVCKNKTKIVKKQRKL